MAQYFYDPSVLEVQNPAPDWVSVNGSSNQIAGGDPDTFLRVSSGSGATIRHSYYEPVFNDTDSAEIDFYVLFDAMRSVALQNKLLLRYSSDGANASRNGYILDVLAGSLQIRRILNNNFATLVTVDYPFTPVVGDPLHVRFSAQGDQIKAKAWQDGPELEWLIEITNNDVYQSGEAALATFSGFQSENYRRVGFGTNGDSAPTGPVGGGAAPVLSLPTATQITASGIVPRVTVTF
jgi:hypothetical protein